jgi:hypothetical protein
MMCHLVFEVAIHGHPDELMPPLVGGVGGTPIALILLVGGGGLPPFTNHCASCLLCRVGIPSSSPLPLILFKGEEVGGV